VPALSEHSSAQFQKILYIGDSGTGKTGSLTSLVAAGYRVRVLDLDNGVQTLKTYVKRECPDKIANVDYETLRDKFTGDQQSGAKVSGQPKAFVNAIKLLTKWSDDSDPAKWGPETILVVDSLTSFGKAGFDWAKGMAPMVKDPRQWYFSAQQSLENIIAMLTSEEFQTNVIVISHVGLNELPDGTVKGFPTSIGKAQGMAIPRYFNTLILAESTGSGTNVRRVIRTVPTGMVDLKTPIPFSLEKELPLPTGLATIMEKLKEA
jgi:hypothetical protein